MDYAALKDALSNPERTKRNQFAILSEIARRVNIRSTHCEGRDLVIRALATKDSFGPSEQTILISLVRSVGLFPYMTADLASVDLPDQLAYELHRAEGLGDGTIFHSLQAKIFHQILGGANVILSASTSAGKSLIVDALVASGRYRKIVVVVPTLALIDEIRRRLLRRFRDHCAVITHPTQESRSDKRNVYVLTQERVLNRVDLDDVGLFVIDEFYKMHLGAGDDDDRAVDLNLAFHRLASTGAQFYLLGPNVQAIRGLDAYEYHFIPSEFSTVAVDVFNLNLPTNGEERSRKLLELCGDADGSTIIYCQSPASAGKVAGLLAAQDVFAENPCTREAADWIAAHYHPDWVVCQALRRGIGVHHGGVPRALQQLFIRLFNEKKIPFLVCSSTIIEGVNTVAKNVIVYDRRKSRQVLDHFTYKNIAGRAGRMMEYFIGRVFVLEKPPDEAELSVDFPIGGQNASTPLGLLLDLDDNELTSLSRTRLASLFRNSTLSSETLRANRHVPVEAQEQIAAAIRKDLDKHASAFVWLTVPDFPQLKAVCGLIFSYLEGSVLRDYNVHSGDQLAWHINSLRMNRNLAAYIENAVLKRKPKDGASDAIERALRFLRNVVCHAFPRDLMVINAIQQDVFTKAGREAGDYGLFSGQAENLFMDPKLFALDEYGVPLQTVERIAPHFSSAATFDDVLEKLRGLEVAALGLSSFEQELLADVQRGI